MSSSEGYNSSSEEAEERQLQRKRRYLWDTGINWTFFALMAIIGFWIIETDVDTYQSERLFYKMLHDGVTLEEAADDPYMQAGMKRNYQYKDASPTDFFIAKWKWRIPIYVGCIILPILVAFMRVISRNRRRWNWAYYPFVAIGLAYWIYFMGRWSGKW